MKGIILAGGLGTRLYPVTKIIPKALLPIYDKPMIYYPLSTFMSMGIKDILIIAMEKDIFLFKSVLGDGVDLGISIKYEIEHEPKGIANAFIIGENFIGSDNVSLILVDNIFYGEKIYDIFSNALNENETATVFGYEVDDPERFGVAEFDDEMNVLSIEEKPLKPKSNYAVVGLYFYDNSVVDIAKSLKPSKRGELEITDVNKVYLKNKKLKVKLIGKENTWFDTGTHKSFVETTVFVKNTEERYGVRFGCIEEIAYRKKYIDGKQLINLANNIKNEYGNYLLNIVREEI